MENSSELNPSCGLRRRSVGPDSSNPKLPLNLDIGFQVSDGGVIKGTPSPLRVNFEDEDPRPSHSSAMAEFRKKQQSFEIHIEDCDEEEMSAGSSDEEGGSRPITPANPAQFPDCSGNVTYVERVPRENFLQVGEKDVECLTDVSEGESDNDDMDEDLQLPKNSVIKRVPS